jgi:hypothetical protein
MKAKMISPTTASDAFKDEATAPDARGVIKMGPDWIMAVCMYCGSADVNIWVKQVPAGHVIVACSCPRCNGASPVNGGLLGQAS